MGTTKEPAEHEDVAMSGTGDTGSAASSQSPAPQTTETRTRRRVAPTPVSHNDNVEDLDGVRRSGRTRKKIKTDEEPVEPPTPKTVRGKKTSVVKSAGGGGGRRPGVWTAEHMLSSKRSKIINAEHSALFNPATWEMFTEAEQDELLALLPSVDYELTSLEPDEPAPRILSSQLFSNLNNDAFKSCFRELQEDLENGFWETGYVKRAEEAAQLRAGELSNAIDKKKNDEYEQWWGQKQKLFHENAGDAAAVSIYELCQQNLFRIGDVFEYRRDFKDIPELVIEKQLILKDIEYGERRSCKLVFSLAKGTGKYVPEAEEDRVQVSTESLPERIVLDEDGRAHEAFAGLRLKRKEPVKLYAVPNGNAWKAFRVFRKNEFIGSTHEIRQRYSKRK